MAGWFHCLQNSTGFRFTSLIVQVLLIWKLIGPFLRKNYLLRYWGWCSLPNWIGALTLSLSLKLPPRKSNLWFVLWSFFLQRLLCISINLPYSHVWNIVVLSGLVLIVATWNCWISYKNRTVGPSFAAFL